MDITVVSASFTRPADTTAYAVNDAMSNATSSPANLTFSECAGRDGRGGMIQAARLIDSAYTVAELLECELWLLDTAPTALEDNAAADLTDAEVANVVAVIEFLDAHQFTANPGAGATGNTFYQRTDLQIPFKCAAGSSDLYGVVIAQNAYVPVSAEVFTFELMIDRWLD